MSVPHYIPFFGADYLKDTQLLSIEEHGAYLLLMLTCWQQEDCSLPDDDRKLARICRVGTRKWKQLRTTMEEFWTIEAGRWTNERLTKERKIAEEKSLQARENAKKRWGSESGKNDILAQKSDKSGEEKLSQPCGKKDASKVEQDTENIDSGQCEGIGDSIQSASPLAEQPQPQRTTLEPSGSNATDDVGSEPIDIVKAIFDSGITVLQRGGKNERQARSLIGGWRKTYTDSIVLTVLAKAQTEKPSEPVAWITRALQVEADKAAGNRNGSGTRNQDRRDGFARELDEKLGIGPAG